MRLEVLKTLVVCQGVELTLKQMFVWLVKSGFDF